MRKLLAICFIFLFALPLYSEFQLRSLKVQVDVDEEGNAHVEEKIDLYLTSRDSVDLYDSGLSSNDLATWRERIGKSDIRHHFDRAVVQIENIRIRPQPVSRCTSIGEQRSNCHATLIFDYDVLPFTVNGSEVPETGLFSKDNFKPRTTRFILNRNALSFGVNQEGDVVLSKDTELAITIPQEAENIYIQPLPQNLEEDVDSIPDSMRTFTWGGIILPKFEFTYEIERSLESEVLEFFDNFAESAASLFSTTEGLVVLLLIGIFVASFVYLNVVMNRK